MGILAPIGPKIIQPGQMIANGLINYWQMNEMGGGRCHDLVGGKHVDAVQSDQQNKWTGSSQGSALTFDGVDDKMTNADTNIGKDLPAISVCAWALSTSSAPAGNLCIFGGNWGNPSESGWALSVLQGDPIFVCPTDTNPDWKQSRFNDKDWDGDRWYLVTGTWSSVSGTIRCYRNNEPATPTAQSGSVTNNNTVALHVGWDATSGYGPWPGFIRSLRIYDREINTNEIAMIVAGHG